MLLKTSCFFPSAEDGDLRGSTCTAPSPIIGWIADGYPILGPCERLDAACTQVVEMRSSWSLIAGRTGTSTSTSAVVTTARTATTRKTYNDAAGGQECCFEKECINGTFQSGVSCTPATCVP